MEAMAGKNDLTPKQLAAMLQTLTPGEMRRVASEMDPTQRAMVRELLKNAKPGRPPKMAKCRYCKELMGARERWAHEPICKARNQPDTKTEIRAARNAAIQADHSSGVAVDALSLKYKLSGAMIRHIIALPPDAPLAQRRGRPFGHGGRRFKTYVLDDSEIKAIRAERGASPDATILLNEVEVATLLRCSQAALRRWRKDGEGPAYILTSRRSVRYTPEALRAWVDEKGRQNLKPE
jgi:predicted DNA-binding transcriptional regulator AlpA